MIATRAFHNENIDFLFRKHGGLHDRLIVEVHVSGVENRFVSAAEKNPGRAEDVASIVEFESERARFIRPRALAGDRNLLSHRAGLPLIRGSVSLTVREEWVEHYSQFF